MSKAISNCRFNADASMGHRFVILMTHVGALRAPALDNLSVSLAIEGPLSSLQLQESPCPNFA